MKLCTTPGTTACMKLYTFLHGRLAGKGAKGGWRAGLRLTDAPRACRQTSASGTCSITVTKMAGSSIFSCGCKFICTRSPRRTGALKHVQNEPSATYLRCRREPSGVRPLVLASPACARAFPATMRSAWSLLVWPSTARRRSAPHTAARQVRRALPWWRWWWCWVFFCSSVCSAVVLIRVGGGGLRSFQSRSLPILPGLSALPGGVYGAGGQRDVRTDLTLCALTSMP